MKYLRAFWTRLTEEPKTTSAGLVISMLTLVGLFGIDVSPEIQEAFIKGVATVGILGAALVAFLARD